MGYSTMMYAVNIGKLKSAFGSRDQDLLALAQAVIHDGTGGAKPVDPTKGPRVRVTWKSEIYFNGKLVSRDEFEKALLTAEWAGMYLYTYLEDPPARQKREGEFRVLSSFAEYLSTLWSKPVQGLPPGAKHIIGICSWSPEEDDDPREDDITEEQAVAELITGTVTQPDNAHAYGYALEYLCRALGTFLGAVGTDRLRSLKLKAPLTKTRLPLRLPKIEDFPYISYLDADEVRDEVTRLRAMDLGCPKDKEIDAERKRFLALLETALAQSQGVVGFYY